MDLTPQERVTLKYYEENGAGWAKLRRNPDFWLGELAEFKELSPSGRIFEIGCGVGHEGAALVRAGYEYVGTDIAESFVQQAKRLYPELTFMQTSAYELPFDNHRFDGFWTVATLIHVPKAKIGQVLNEIKRVVRPGGCGFIAIKEGEGESMDSKNRLTAYYSASEFTQILAEYGLAVINTQRKVADPNTWLAFWVRLEP